MLFRSNNTIYYQIFNAGGSLQASNKISKSLTANTTSLMFNHNDYLKINTAAQGTTVLNLQDNAAQVLSSTGVINAGSQAITNQPVTFTESNPNSGFFLSYDENNVSELVTTSNAARGKSASVEFNQKTSSIVIGFGSATITTEIYDSEWRQGNDAFLTIMDSDANKSTRNRYEGMNLNDFNATLIPSLRIGSPFTLGANGTEAPGTVLAKFGNMVASHTGGTQQGPNQFTSNGTFTYLANPSGGIAVTVQKFSDRALISSPGGTYGGMAINYGKSVADLKKVVYRSEEHTSELQSH